MTAVQFNRIGQSYCSDREKARGPGPSEGHGQPHRPTPSELSDHLLRDIGVLDGYDVRCSRFEAAFSSYDLLDRYR